MAEGRRHAVVLEAAGRVHPFVLQMQATGGDANVLGHARGGLQQRLSLADGHALIERREGEQVVEAPHAAETVRIVAAGPFLLDGRPGSGRTELVPRIGHVQQAAAVGAGNTNLIDGVGRTAGGRNALLIDGDGGRNCRAFNWGGGRDVQYLFNLGKTLRSIKGTPAS